MSAQACGALRCFRLAVDSYGFGVNGMAPASAAVEVAVLEAVRSLHEQGAPLPVPQRTGMLWAKARRQSGMGG